MELSSRQIQDRDFPTALRGYDRAAVDTFMSECENLTSALEERTRIAEVRAASNERELAAQRANIDALLQDATDARRKIIDEAKAEADSIRTQATEATGSQGLTDAATRATAIINEAEHKARMRLEEIEQIRESAEQDAELTSRRVERSVATARAEADELLDAARLEADSILVEARATQASMEAQLAEVRQLLGAARAGETDSELVIDLRDHASKPQGSQVSP